MKASKMREQSDEELKKELTQLLREQFNLRMQRGAGQSPRPDQFTKVRRDIARIKTVLNERVRAANHG